MIPDPESYITSHLPVLGMAAARALGKPEWTCESLGHRCTSPDRAGCGPEKLDVNETHFQHPRVLVGTLIFHNEYALCFNPVVLNWG